MAGQQIPDLVANLRVDQPWGSVQLSGAAHQLRTSLYGPLTPAAIGVLANPGLGGLPGAAGVAPIGIASPFLTQNDFGFACRAASRSMRRGSHRAIRSTHRLRMRPGAIGYITGNTLAYTGGFLGLFAQLRQRPRGHAVDERLGLSNLQRLRLHASQQVREAARRSGRGGLQALLAADLELGVLRLGDGGCATTRM